MNASLLQENCVDELSIVLAPLVDGGMAASMFDRPEFLPKRGAAVFSLQGVERLDGNGLWLRYAAVRK